jgi:predicted phage terminase large subunit-like protein
MPTLPENVLKNSLFAFCVEYSRFVPPDGFYPEPLHLFLCRTIQDAILNNKRIIITVPPQHGKSTFASVFAPIWYLYNNPNRNVILVSYAAELAEAKSVQARAVAREVFPSLSVDVDSKKNWSLPNALDISFRARGVGGGITGSAGDLLLLDDLIKNHEEAESRAMRDKTWSFIESTVSTRLSNTSAVIAILTRWHLDDYASRLNKLWGWPIINIPAICVDPDNDPLQRQLGEVAAPRLKPLGFINKAKENLSNYVFSSLYQGDPRSSESSRFQRDWFKYYPASDMNMLAQSYNVYQTVDTSGKASDSSDYFVILTFVIVTQTVEGELILNSLQYEKAKKNNVELIQSIYIIDVMRQRFATTEHQAAMRIAREKWRPVVQYVEEAVYGLAIVQDAQQKGLAVEPLKADGSKYLRSEQISVMYRNGRVYHPDKADWLKLFEDELVDFPVGTHDDQVDCVSYAGIVASQKIKLV